MKDIEKRTSEVASANHEIKGLELNEVASDFVPQEKLQLLGNFLELLEAE